MRRGILKWLIRTDKIASTEKLVLIVLWLFQDDDGECCPSVTEIAAASSLNRATVTRTLGKLEEKGVIIRAHRYNKNGHKSNSYQIVPQIPSKRAIYAQLDTMSGAESDTHSRTTRRCKKPKVEEPEVSSSITLEEVAQKIIENIERYGMSG